MPDSVADPCHHYTTVASSPFFPTLHFPTTTTPPAFRPQILRCTRPSPSHAVPAQLAPSPTPTTRTPTMVIATASTHAGGSGGALLDSRGRLVGLVTSNARHVAGGTLPRLAFCIAAEELEPVVAWCTAHDQAHGQGHGQGQAHGHGRVGGVAAALGKEATGAARGGGSGKGAGSGKAAYHGLVEELRRMDGDCPEAARWVGGWVWVGLGVLAGPWNGRWEQQRGRGKGSFVELACSGLLALQCRALPVLCASRKLPSLARNHNCTLARVALRLRLHEYVTLAGVRTVRLLMQPDHGCCRTMCRFAMAAGYGGCSRRIWRSSLQRAAMEQDPSHRAAVQPGLVVWGRLQAPGGTRRRRARGPGQASGCPITYASSSLFDNRTTVSQMETARSHLAGQRLECLSLCCSSALGRS